MINHPIGEKWKERLVKEVTDSDGRLMPLTAISFIENLLEQERKRMSEEIYQARKSNTTDSAGDVWEKVLSIINK